MEIINRLKTQNTPSILSIRVSFGSNIDQYFNMFEWWAKSKYYQWASLDIFSERNLQKEEI